MGHYASEMGYPMDTTPQAELEARGYAIDDSDYKYIGRAETSLIDNGTLLWMCRRDGAVVAHQGLHEEAAHGVQS